MKNKLIKDLKHHEGYNWLAPKSARLGKSKFGAYLDHLGYKTTGVGHLIVPQDELKYPEFNLDELTEEQAEVILLDDIEKHERILYRYFDRNGIKKEDLNENQLRALINMTFQMGDLKAAGFRKMTKALAEKDYIEAVEQMKDSKWHTVQTPKRAKKVIEIFETPVELADVVELSTAKRQEPELSKKQSILEVILDLILRLFRG